MMQESVEAAHSVSASTQSVNTPEREDRASSRAFEEASRLSQRTFPLEVTPPLLRTAGTQSKVVPFREIEVRSDGPGQQQGCLQEALQAVHGVDVHPEAPFVHPVEDEARSRRRPADAVAIDPPVAQHVQDSLRSSRRRLDERRQEIDGTFDGGLR